MYKIAVLVSGGGTNLQAVIDNIESGFLEHCSIHCVISDNPKAYGIERAKSKDIKTYVLDKKVYGDNLCDEILKLTENEVDLIVLAGWLSILKGDLVKKFKNRIINIHPSLIPSFCGKGMYGIKVHEKALEYGVKISGCTVHFVDEGTDTGPIIIQKAVEVKEDDTAESLQKRVLVEEHKALSEAIKLLSEKPIQLTDKR